MWPTSVGETRATAAPASIMTRRRGSRVGVGGRRDDHAEPDEEQPGRDQLVGDQAGVEAAEHVGELLALGVRRREGHQQQGRDRGGRGRDPEQAADPAADLLAREGPGSTSATNPASPVATSRPTYMTTPSTPWTAVTVPDEVGGGGGSATLSLRSPTEKVSDPEMGCPSADTTNHATTKLPRSTAPGSGRSTTTSLPEVDAAEATVPPSAS